MTDNDSTTTTPEDADLDRKTAALNACEAAGMRAVPQWHRHERRALLLDLYHHFAVGAVETQIVPYDTAETFRDRLYQEIIR